MKTMKKLTCVMVALVLMLALCVTAFATGTGSITVDNPSNGVTYTAYKIFDVVYNTDKTAYSYTIALNPKSPWYDVVATYDGVTLTPAATGDVSIVTKNDNFSAAEFSNLLHANINGKTGIPLKAADGNKATATGLDLGYYLVVGANNALANLTTTNPSVTIHDKNDVPFDKVDDKESVEIGEVVNYTINGKVPDTTGFTSYEYTITDTMSEGLTFNDDVKVYVGNVELTGNYTYEKVGNGFKVTIKVMDIQDKVSQPIVVKYTATVNENAIAKISENDAKLVYSNNPTDSKKHGELTDKETVYSAKIKIVKYHDALEDTNNRLPNAKFVLSKKVMEGEKEGVDQQRQEKHPQKAAEHRRAKGSSPPAEADQSRRQEREPRREAEPQSRLPPAPVVGIPQEKEGKSQDAEQMTHAFSPSFWISVKIYKSYFIISFILYLSRAQFSTNFAGFFKKVRRKILPFSQKYHQPEVKASG